MAWLRYQHMVPDMSDWLAIRGETEPVWDDAADAPFGPRLITDMYAYNTDVQRGHLGNGRYGNPGTLQVGNDRLGLHWVGDLLVECHVEVIQAGGELLLDLVEAWKTLHVYD